MRTLFYCFFLSTFLVTTASAVEYPVGDAESARKAVRDAKPGDVIVLREGTWKDVDLRLDGEGTAENPITIRAAVPGKTVITGASRVRLGGVHLILSGIRMENLSGKNSDWLEFRIDSKRRARHCRVTECLFSEAPEFEVVEKENHWIGLFGSDNQVDHCRIVGKKNKGATLVVWLGDEDLGNHRILQNDFGERPRLGSNGGETIRVGDSGSSMRNAQCLIEGNRFFHCDGEAECISNKSCGNTYRGNLFREVQGTLTLRHGNNCLVEGNFFLGAGRRGTGGVRITGEDHRVLKNYFEELEGDDFRSAIALINGIPNSPENGYLQVKRASVVGNVIVNCKESLLIGYNDVNDATLAPLDCRLEENFIFAREGGPAVKMVRAPVGIHWRENLYSGELIGMDPVPGLTSSDFKKPPRPDLPDEKEIGLSWKLES